MISASSILKILKKNEYKFFSGVPCSYLKELLAEISADKDVEYVPAVKENLALGVASGAYLAKKKSAIFIQNSGLGNIINALTSFNLIYKIPVLMFISYRGHDGKDSPEHLIMGERTIGFLKDLNIPHVILSEKYEEEIGFTINEMEKRSIPAAIIIKKGIIK